MGGPIRWSTNAASNDTSDPDIYLVEGQDPPSLNNASRAIMAGMKSYALDQAGGLVASGIAGNALTLASYQIVGAVDALDNGFEIAFQVTGANTGPVTLNVDGTGAKPLRRQGNLELGPGDLRTNEVYHVVYLAPIGCFLLKSPQLIRPGRIEAFASAAAVPLGWALCDGTAYLRATHAALFSMIGTIHGEGNGSTTFNVPDMRGRAPFGWNAGTGRLTAAGGLTGDIGDVGGLATVPLSVAQLPAFTPTGTVQPGGARATGTTGLGGGTSDKLTEAAGGHTPQATASAVPPHRHTGDVNGAGHAHGTATATLKNVRAGSGTELSGIWAGPDKSDVTDSATPNLTFACDLAGGHTPSIDCEPVPPHRHLMSGVDPHTHSVPSIPAHDHDLSMNPIGSGAGHANIPPGSVVVWAIKV